MATVGAVELIANLRFKIRMTPPATAGITTKMIEIFQSNIHGFGSMYPQKKPDPNVLMMLTGLSWSNFNVSATALILK